MEQGLDDCHNHTKTFYKNFYSTDIDELLI